MSVWILVLVLARGDGLHTNVIAEFQTEANCMAAAQRLRGDVYERVTIAVSVTCLSVRKPG